MLKAIKNWFADRSKEPTTWISVSLLVQALGLLGKVNEAPQIADAVATAAEPLSRGDFGTAGVAIGGALLGIVLREKGSK